MKPRMKKLLASGVGLALVAGGATGLLLPSGAGAVAGAAFTTVNEDVDGSGHCANGNPTVNCNIYDGKQYVWLNGGPAVAQPGAGTYFFAVLSPGGQPGPNDGSTNVANGALANLSDDVDAYTNRTFSIDSSGTISYSGTHDFADNKIRLADYADTPNPGGVYVLAICSLDKGYPVDPSRCKYDAFKIKVAGTTPPAADPAIAKDAAGSYNTTWKWGIGKSVDNTVIKQIGGNATFNYTVSVTHDGGTDSAVKVTGTITVFNTNSDPVTGVNVTDQLSDTTVCAVTGGLNQTINNGATDFPYECDLASVPQGELDNTATVTWEAQSLSDGDLAAGSADFTFSNVAFTQTKVDDCVAVTDSYKGSLGTVCQTDASPATFKYSRTVAVPANRCVNYDNTATFTTNTSGTTGSASQTVTVCGAVTGGLTIGFWQNKNGQGIITAANQTNLGNYLRGYHPFSDAPATGEAAYVSGIIKAATCTSTGKTCNTMLRAQMLATALNAYFSDPALGGNKINAPTPLGAVKVDLTKICKMIDGTGGTASCSGTYENVSSAFGGATSLTIAQMLAYQNTSDPLADAGAVWYGQVKATQVLAKDAFDAINNGVAFSA